MKDPMKNAGHHPMMTGIVPVAAKNMAGPGHCPQTPQPNPKHIPPNTRLQSIMAFVGILNLEVAIGHSRAYLFLEKSVQDATN